MTGEKRVCKRCNGKGATRIPYNKEKHKYSFVWPDATGRPSYVLRECKGCANKGYVLVGGTCGVPLIPLKKRRARKVAV